MKMYYCWQKSSVITYRKFKNFCNIEFIKDLEEHWRNLNTDKIRSNLFRENMNIILEKSHTDRKAYKK